MSKIPRIDLVTQEIHYPIVENNKLDTTIIPMDQYGVTGGMVGSEVIEGILKERAEALQGLQRKKWLDPLIRFQKLIEEMFAYKLHKHSHSTHASPYPDKYYVNLASPNNSNIVSFYVNKDTKLMIEGLKLIRLNGRTLFDYCHPGYYNPGHEDSIYNLFLNPATKIRKKEMVEIVSGFRI